MSKKNESSCCAPAGSQSCCRVETLISVDERGQLVLPKGLREKAKIKAGDKFALISCESGGKLCCIAMVKSDEFAGKIKEFLGPLLKDIIG